MRQACHLRISLQLYLQRKLLTLHFLGMFNPRCFILHSMLALLLTSAVAAAGTQPDLPQAAQDYQKRDAEIFYGPGTSLFKAREHTSFYNEHFGQYLQHGEIAVLAPGDLQNHFDALARVVTYTHDRRQVALMEQVFDRLLAAGVRRPENYRTLYRALLAIRDFDAAAAFLAAHPPKATEPLPHIVPLTDAVPADRTAWRAAPAARTLSRVRIDMPMGPYVIVYANPACRFSRAAVAAIHADQAWTRHVAPHSKFLVPPDSNFSFDSLQAWNLDHPDETMLFIHSLYEWPELEEWSTPVFYFFRDRKLITTVHGWPPEGNLAAVKAATAAIGIP